jgi:hypothetical protein
MNGDFLQKTTVAAVAAVSILRLATAANAVRAGDRSLNHP